MPPQRTQVLAFELVTDVIRSVLAKDDDGVIPLTERMGEEQLAGRIEQELVERDIIRRRFHRLFSCSELHWINTCRISSSNN